MNIFRKNLQTITDGIDRHQQFFNFVDIESFGGGSINHWCWIYSQRFHPESLGHAWTIFISNNFASTAGTCVPCQPHSSVVPELLWQDLDTQAPTVELCRLGWFICVNLSTVPEHRNLRQGIGGHSLSLAYRCPPSCCLCLASVPYRWVPGVSPVSKCPPLVRSLLNWIIDHSHTFDVSHIFKGPIFQQHCNDD